MIHSLDELIESKKQIESILNKVKASLSSLQTKKDSSRYQSQITLALRRIDAFQIALELIEREIKQLQS